MFKKSWFLIDFALKNSHKFIYKKNEFSYGGCWKIFFEDPIPASLGFKGWIISYLRASL